MAHIGDSVSFIKQGKRIPGKLSAIQQLSDEAAILDHEGLYHIVSFSDIEQPIEREDDFTEFTKSLAMLHADLTRERLPECDYPTLEEAGIKQ